MPDISRPISTARSLPSKADFRWGWQAQSAYEEARVELKPGTQITLLTDGVVEARSATGELFGFPRTQTLSRKSAEQIMQAAVAFGQEDDITVVTLALADGKPSPVASENSTHSSGSGCALSLRNQTGKRRCRKETGFRFTHHHRHLVN
jgi:serine/threonine protein phosphatase PrpC